jgi:peptidoglycan hydrolase CwlO-like protein
METLLTVLITLMVVALTGAGINLVRLNRKAEELDTIQMDMEDISNRIDRMIENLERDLRQSDEDLHKDCVDRINGVISSTDRRIDYIHNDIQKLDETVNPNKDFLKK